MLHVVTRCPRPDACGAFLGGGSKCICHRRISSPAKLFLYRVKFQGGGYDSIVNLSPLLFATKSFSCLYCSTFSCYIVFNCENFIVRFNPKLFSFTLI